MFVLLNDPVPIYIFSLELVASKLIPPAESLFVPISQFPIFPDVELISPFTVRSVPSHNKEFVAPFKLNFAAEESVPKNIPVWS